MQQQQQADSRPAPTSSQKPSLTPAELKSLCDCIEAHLATPAASFSSYDSLPDGSINWARISELMKRAGHESAAPSLCREAWHFLAYGTHCGTTASKRSHSSSSSSAGGSSSSATDDPASDQEDAYMQPFRAVRRFHMRSDVTLLDTTSTADAASNSTSTSSSSSSGGGDAGRSLARVRRGADPSSKMRIMLCKDPVEPTQGLFRPLITAPFRAIQMAHPTPAGKLPPPGLAFSAAFNNPRSANRRGAAGGAGSSSSSSSSSSSQGASKVKGTRHPLSSKGGRKKAKHLR